MTRMPRWRDSATFSAYCRHTLHRRKVVSPSFHSLVCLSSTRVLEATVNDATAAPLGVNRSSGSLVRLPVIVTGMSPWAMGFLLPVRTDDLGAEHGLVEVELPVE